MTGSPRHPPGDREKKNRFLPLNFIEMKKITLTALMLAIVGTPALVQAQEETNEVSKPTLDKTFANWEGRSVIYDVAVMGVDAKANLEKMENVTVHTLEHWIELGGNLGHVGWGQPQASEEINNTEGVDGGIVKDSPSQGLFGMNNPWWQYWAGGWCNQGNDKPVDMSHICADTHVHLAIKPVGDVVPQVLNIKMLALKTEPEGGDPCVRFSLVAENKDDAYNASFPVVGTMKPNEWIGVDMTIGEVDRLLSADSEVRNSELKNIDLSRFTTEWSGSVFNLSMPVNQDLKKNEGAMFAVDGVYFYTPGRVVAGVEAVAASDSAAEIVVTGRSISVLGGEGIEVYTVGGRLVASTTGTVVGVDHLEAGIYVVKAAGKVMKAAIK